MAGGSISTPPSASPAGWLVTEPEEVLQATLLPIPPVRPLDPGEDRRQVVRLLVLDPAYQLK